MRIRLQQSDAARLELELPHADGRPRTVCLTEVRGASGAIERVVAGATGRELWARGVRAASAVVDHLEWPLPGGGRVAATSPGAVAGLTLELHARETSRAGDDAPVSGRAALTRAGARAIAIELGGGQRLAVDVDASAAALELSPERIGYASMERLELGNLQTALGAWLVRVSAAALDRLRADWRDGELLVGAGGGRLGASTVTAEGVTVDIEGGQLAEGMRTSGRALVIPEVVLPEVRIAVDDLVALVRRHLPPEPPPARRAATDSGRFRFDFGFLDRITGRLDVDLTMELSVPVIGKREATHHFRIPIVSGALNYRELERDLAGVEDAFIDLEVRGRSLVLERRIPLLGLEKPLVVWELTQEELELARKRLVLLRTVPRMQLVRSGGGGDGKGPIAVRRLRFGAVEIELSLAPSEEEEPDAIGSVSVASLRAGGELVYDVPGAARRSGVMAAVPPAGAPADPGREPITSRAELAIERLAGGPFEVPAGPARLEVDRIEVAEVEGEVEFAGLRPRGARLVARGVLLRNLKIALPA